MATVILHTSCAFPHGNGADPLGDGGPAAARFGAGPGVGGVNRGIPPLASSTSHTGEHPFGPFGVHQLLGASAHPPPRGRAGPSDHDVLAARAIHCDVSLVPRIPLDDSESPSSNAVQRLQSLHLASQPLLPCGRSNFISVEDLPLAAGDDGGAYLLGLAHCHIQQADGGGGASPLALPAAAAPSTFALSFREEGGGTSFGGDTIHVVGGGVHRIGEVAVAFDFGEAVELYRERIGKQEKEAECPSMPSNAGVLLQASGGHNSTAPQPEQRRSDVASILRSLEEESAFVRKTLAALGCAGVVVVGALGWTLWKMSRGKRPRRRRARAANDARRHGVPHEIGARVANGSAEAAPGDEGRRRVPVTPDVSPLQPPPVVDPRGRDVRLQFPAISPVRRSSDDEERAGDLRLVSPRTPPPSPLSANEDLGATEEGKQQSPRHWYESLLSPPAEAVAKKDGEACLAVPTFSFAKEDVARALYSPLKSTAKKASDEQGRQLDFDTPMARLSKLAPTPSKVSPGTLSRMLDEGSLDRASREGEDAIEPPAQTGQAAFDEELRSVASELSKKSEDDAGSPARLQNRDSALEDEQCSVDVEDATIDRGLLSTTTELNDLLDDVDDSLDNPVDATLVTVDTSTEPLEALRVKAVSEGNVSLLSIASDGTAEDSMGNDQAPRELQVVSPDAPSVTDAGMPFSFASPSLLPELDAAAGDVPAGASDTMELAEESPAEEDAVVEEEVASVNSLSTESGDFDETSSASSEILLTPDNSSRESAGILDEEVNEAGVDEDEDEEDEDGIASPPKVKVERYPMGFLEELTEKTSGRATSPKLQTPSPRQDFESSLAECAALLKTPKRLTPVPSTPDSSEGSSSNEFLSDYWQT